MNRLSYSTPSQIEMNLDSSNMDYADRFEACRKADAEKEGLIQEILQNHEDLRLAHKTLLREFDNERECRQMWMDRCKDSQLALTASNKAFDDAKRLAESGSFVVIILDGDGAIFQDDLYNKGKEGGGLAASQLETEVKAYLKRLYPDQSTSSWTVIAYVFLNVQGLAGALHESSLLPGSPQFGTAAQLAAFGHTFSNANALFNFVDVGNGKERADYKARETLRAFLPLMQCKHVFFGPCHDNGYLPVLEPLSFNLETKSRITLISTRTPERGFSSLGFDMVEFPTVFRPTDLPGRLAGPSRLSSARPSESTVNGTHEDESSSRSTGSPTLTPTNTPAQISAAATSSWVAVVGRPSGNQTINLSSQRDEKLTTYITLSINDERLDPDLPQYPQRLLAEFEDKRRKAGANFCNEYHFFGSCRGGPKCYHTHGPRLSQVEQNILKDKARGIVCYSGSECRDFTCYRGHQCKYGRNCNMEGCRMARFHNVNTIPYKKLYEDGREETLNGSRR